MDSRSRLRRVAFVTDFYPETHAKWSGAEIACQRLRELLTDKGVDVGVFTSKADFPELMPPFVEEVPILEDASALVGTSVKALFPFDLSAYRFFLRRFAESSPDIVHLHNLKLMSFAPLLAAEKLGIPVVFSAYDNWALCPRCCLVDSKGSVCDRFHGPGCVLCVPLKKKPFVLLRRQVFALFMKKLGALAVLTGSERDRFARSGADPARVHILPLPLFAEGGDSAPSSAAVERGTILFVGRIEQAKGLHMLVEAMPEVLKRHKGARVTVVGEHSGSDRYKKEVLARIEGLGLRSAFSFLGKVGNDGIKKLLLKSHVVVAPEQWPIAWPIFLTEAMAMGKRVVASRIGDIPEFIRDDSIGYLAAHDSVEDFAVKISAALASGEDVNLEASAMIRRLCDSRAITGKLLSVYHGVLKGKGP